MRFLYMDFSPKADATIDLYRAHQGLEKTYLDLLWNYAEIGWNMVRTILKHQPNQKEQMNSFHI